MQINGVHSGDVAAHHAHAPHVVSVVVLMMHYAKSYRPFELFVNENYKL